MLVACDSDDLCDGNEYDCKVEGISGYVVSVLAVGSPQSG